MAEPFAVRSERHGRTRRLTATGELDIATAPIFEDRLDAVHEDNPELLIVDLSELTFMDSTGVHLLVRLNEQWQPPGRLWIITHSPAVERILDMTGARALLPIISPGDDPLAARLAASGSG